MPISTHSDFSGLFAAYRLLEVLTHGGLAAGYVLRPGGGEELSDPLAAALRLRRLHRRIRSRHGAAEHPGTIPGRGSSRSYRKWPRQLLHEREGLPLNDVKGARAPDADLSRLAALRERGSRHERPFGNAGSHASRRGAGRPNARPEHPAAAGSAPVGASRAHAATGRRFAKAPRRTRCRTPGLLAMDRQRAHRRPDVLERERRPGARR